MILDSDSLIDLKRGHVAATAWLQSLPQLPKVAGFAAMELVAGSQNAIELRQVQTFLTAFTLVWPSETDLDTALHQYLPLRLQHGLGLLDCVIAATATGLGLPLVTFNVRHFRVVPGLQTTQPYTR